MGGGGEGETEWLGVLEGGPRTDPEYAVSLVKKVGMRGLLGSLSQPGDSASFLELPTGLGEVPKFPLRTVFPLLRSHLSSSTLVWEIRQGESQDNSG